MYQNPYNTLAWIRGFEKGNIVIGENAWIGPFCVVDGEYNKIKIGKGLNLSSGAQIITHDTVKRCVTNSQYNKIDSSPITIGDYVYIGTNAIILRGTTIGNHCVIAAGTIILENSIIPDFSLVVGVPGKIKKNIKDEFEKWTHNPIQ